MIRTMLFMTVIWKAAVNLEKRELPSRKLVVKVCFDELYTVSQSQVTIDLSYYIPGIFPSKCSYNFSICLEYRILCNIKMTPGNNNVNAFNRYDNDSNTFLLFKPKILNAIKFIRDRKNVLIWKLYLTI